MVDRCLLLSHVICLGLYWNETIKARWNYGMSNNDGDTVVKKRRLAYGKRKMAILKYFCAALKSE